MRRSHGERVLVAHARVRYTATAILSAETDVLAAATEHTGTAVEAGVADTVLAEMERTGARLDEDQRRFARAFCVDDRRIVAGLGPAGSGKTTAMPVGAHEFPRLRRLSLT